MPKDLNQLLQPVPDNIRQMRIGTDEATGLGIHRGDLVLIDTTLQPMFGDIVVASIAGRWRPRLLQRLSGRIILTAKTFSTPDSHYEVWAQLDILGVVTYSIHAFGRMSKWNRRVLPVRPSVATAHKFTMGSVR